MRPTHMIISALIGLGGYGVGNTIDGCKEEAVSQIQLLQAEIQHERVKVYAMAKKIEEIREELRQ